MTRLSLLLLLLPWIRLSSCFRFSFLRFLLLRRFLSSRLFPLPLLLLLLLLFSLSLISPPWLASR